MNLTLSETPMTGFLATRPIFYLLMVCFAMQGLWLPLVAHNFDLYLLIGLIKVNPRLISSDDILQKIDCNIYLRNKETQQTKI